MNIRLLAALLLTHTILLPVSLESAEFTGRIVDLESGEIIPARLYIQSEDGEWLFARSASDRGSAYYYRKERGENSVEMHTTLSPHPFVAELKPGRYTFTIERGKEYLPLTREIVINGEDSSATFRLKRWINMADRDWYSGDTHVHRVLAELPNVMMAEDLNVGLPLTYWVTVAGKTPAAGKPSADRSAPAELIKLDETHVIYPLNTEYEIFTTAGKRHTLGAVFVLNHKKPLTLPVPPVLPVAEEARRQGALLELDKHSWPWSMMLVPVMDVDLFELSNNHIWRTEFAFRQWTIDSVPESMDIERDDRGMTEWGWMDFGFKTYYALLNCGFRMRPTAGTASGVHPVPLGFGRVYVHLPDGFSYGAWMDGLDAGRSFVTTGPMLFSEFNGRPPGEIFSDFTGGCKVSGSVESAVPLDRIEVIVNGEVANHLEPANEKSSMGGLRSEFEVTIPIDSTSWVAVRCFEKHPGNRVRFAHSAPVHFDVADAPLRPTKVQVQYFVNRMREELGRNRGVLDEASLMEYSEALKKYEEIARSAR